MSYCAAHNLNDTNGRGCVECIRDERDAARAEAARLREALVKLVESSQRVLLCEGWDRDFWCALPYQAQFRTVTQQGEAALEGER